MYTSVTAQLARRGFQVATRLSARDAANPSQEDLELLEAIARAKSPTTVALLIGTSVVFLLFSVLVEYVIRHVIGTLAAIEHVQDESSLEFELDGLLNEDEDGVPGSSSVKDYEDVRIPVDNAAAKSGSEDTQKFLSDKERVGDGKLTREAPVTRSIFSALRCLRRNGGIRSCFRGFRLFFAWSILNATFFFLLSLALKSLPQFIADTLAFVVSFVITAPMHCSWTHAMIRVRAGPGAVRVSTPATTSSWRRYLPGFWSKHLVLPSIRFSAYVIILTQASLKIRDVIASGLPKDLSFVAFTLLGFSAPMIFMAAAGLLVIVPTVIALARVEASLLPKGEDALVPFDRQSVTSKSNGVWWKYVWVNLSLVGAWKSFDMETYWRVAKLYVKFGAMTLLILAVMFAALWLELYVVLHGHMRLIALMVLPV